MQEIVETSLGKIYRANKYEDILDHLEFGCDFGELHYGFPVNPESLKNFYSNPVAFADCFLYGYFDKEKNLKSIIWFKRGYDPLVNKKVLSQFAWFSKDPKYSIRLLDEALNHINLYYKYEILLMGRLERSTKKLDNFYFKKGFLKEGASFYKLLV